LQHRRAPIVDDHRGLPRVSSSRGSCGDGS
jgi:hypothetical protein